MPVTGVFTGGMYHGPRMRPALGAGSSLYEWRNPDGASRIANGNFGKRCATYPANLCPFRGGGAASSSRPRRTILPNESGNSKRFCDNRLPASGTPAKWGFSGHSQVRQLERKEELKAYPPGDGRFVKRRTSVKDWPVFCDQGGFYFGPSLWSQFPDTQGPDRRSCNGGGGSSTPGRASS